MPTFELRCGGCDVEYTAVLEDSADLDKVACPACKSVDYECEGYDAMDSPRLLEIQKRLTAIEQRLSDLVGDDTDEDERTFDDLSIN